METRGNGDKGKWGKGEMGTRGNGDKGKWGLSESGRRGVLKNSII